MSKLTPSFIGVGAPKSGTTWLAKMLGAHPQLFVPEKKEINFFNNYQTFYLEDPDYVRKYDGDVGSYLKYFEDAEKGQLTGEFSVFYLYDKEVPKLLQKHFPEVKIIILVRNPIQRFYSNYLFAKAQGYTNMPDVEEVIEHEGTFIQEGMYMRHIENYLRHFPREQLFIGLFDDIKNKPEELLREVYRFLEVDDSFVPDGLEDTVNSGKQIDNPVVRAFNAFRDFVLQFSLGRKLYEIPFLRTYTYKTRLYISKLTFFKKDFKPTATSEIPDSIREKLTEIYTPSIKELEKFLNRDLTHWYTSR